MLAITNQVAKNDINLICETKTLTLCIRETPKRVLFQTVNTQMKCSIMLHFIRVNTVKVKKDLQTDKIIQYLKKNIIPDAPRYVQWTIPNLLYQTRRKNLLVYKGLISIILLVTFLALFLDSDTE